MVAAAHRVIRVEAQLAVQAVLAQQQRLGPIRVACVADELLGRQQPADRAVAASGSQRSMLDPVAGYGGVAGRVQSEMRVQEVASGRDHPVSSDRVVGAGCGASVGGGQHVGPVEGVVEASPAGVGGVQGVASVVDGHHQLGPGHRGDLGIDAVRGDGHFGVVLAQIPDVVEESLVGLRVVRAPVCTSGAMPVVDLGLELVAPCQKGRVARPQVVEDRFQSLPELLAFDPGVRQSLIGYELMKLRSDVEPSDAHADSQAQTRRAAKSPQACKPVRACTSPHRIVPRCSRSPGRARPCRAVRVRAWLCGAARAVWLCCPVRLVRLLLTGGLRGRRDRCHFSHQLTIGVQPR